MSPGNSIVIPLLFTFNMSVAGASDAYSGHRLFYEASERSALDASVLHQAVTEQEPVVAAPEISDEYVPAFTQHSVLFNGFVVRHRQNGQSTAVTWVDGQSTPPSLWRLNAGNGYKHVVYRFGRRLVLKPGQSRRILLEKKRGSM